jgi:hypothetical protein
MFGVMAITESPACDPAYAPLSLSLDSEIKRAWGWVSQRSRSAIGRHHRLRAGDAPNFRNCGSVGELGKR